MRRLVPLFAIVAALALVNAAMMPLPAMAQEALGETAGLAETQSDTRDAVGGPGCLAACGAGDAPQDCTREDGTAFGLIDEGEAGSSGVIVGDDGGAVDGGADADANRHAPVNALFLYSEGVAGDVQLQVRVQDIGMKDSLPAGVVSPDAGASAAVEGSKQWLHDSAVALLRSGEVPHDCDAFFRMGPQDGGWREWDAGGYDVLSQAKGGQGDGIASPTIWIVRKPCYTGWFNDGAAISYIDDGARVAGQWIVTEDAPIYQAGGLQRYWVDAEGTLAVSRLIDPADASDAGSYQAYATENGFVQRNGALKVGGSWRMADNDGRLTACDVGQLVEEAVSWAVAIAADNSHGYSQDDRWGPDYDCSSLVIAALAHAGFCVGAADDTENMMQELTRFGFEFITDLSQLRRGDIVFVRNSAHHHTEIYLGNGQLVGATSSETGGIRGRTGDQTGSEIRVGPYYNMPWAGFFRAS